MHNFLRLVAATVVGLLVSHAAAQPPLPMARLNSIFPAGGQQGTTFDVTVSGVDLDEARQLRFTHVGITAQPKMSPADEFYPESRPIPGQFTVSIAADVPEGIYDVRAVGRYGISSPRTFVVGRLPEVRETGGNGQPATAQEVPVESIVNGTADQAARDYFRFNATAGKRLMITCAAYCIDSRMDPTMVLYDPAGREIARSQDSQRRDPLIDVTIPTDGAYTVEVYDFLYGGGPEHFYRLAISSGPYIEFVFPPAGLPGTNSTYTLYGRNLPGGVPSDVQLDGRPLEKLDVQIQLPADAQAQGLSAAPLVEPHEAGTDALVYQLATPSGKSNAVKVFYARAPTLTEAAENGTAASAQGITPPCEVAGQFYPRGDQDWFTFEAQQGAVLWIEVISQRLGRPTDPYMLITRVEKTEQGEEKISDVIEMDDPKSDGQNRQNRRGFDTTTDDPAYRFVAPAAGTYRILVRDLYYGSRGDASHIYRLLVRPEQPDFRLVAVAEAPPNPQNNNAIETWSHQLHPGGSAGITIKAFRRENFAGEITVTAEGLPAGVTTKGALIGPGNESTTLVLTATPEAPAWNGDIKIVGRAKIGDTEVVREARSGTVVWGANNRQVEVPRARMSGTLALAVNTTEKPVATLETPGMEALENCLAGKFEVPVKVHRREGFAGNVKVTLEGLDQNFQVQDADIAGGATDGKINVQVRNNAPVGTYTFTVRGIGQVKYARNPAAAEAAEQERKRIEELAQRFAEEAKKAAEAAAQANNALTQAQNELKAATDRFNAAKTQAEQKPDDQALVQAKSEAEAAMAQAQQKMQAATEAKTAADQASTAAAEKSKRGEVEKKNSADRARQAAEAAKPKDASAFLYSPPVTLKITPAPIKLAEASVTAPLNQGGKAETKIRIERLYGFNEQVELNVEIPGGVAGLQFERLVIPAGQNEGQLKYEASDQATLGTHTLTLRAKMNLNGQNLQLDQPLPVSVVAVSK